MMPRSASRSAGQRVVKQIVVNLRQHGATPIEVDTDGVYFVPPPDVTAPQDEEAFIDRVAANLPPGIRLGHDGRFAGMLSLKLKTYALLSHDGVMSLKGSSLRSRRMEPCFPAASSSRRLAASCATSEIRCGKTISTWPSASAVVR